jgi:methylated-DNA-protein-cysteine methyltransferase-like protein
MLPPEDHSLRFKRTSFFKQVYRIVRQIPRGEVLTYGQIATLVGAPHMARQVGWAMHGCPTGLPWQRVVGAGGKILINSMSSGEGPLLQRKLLELEGVHFTGKCVDMKIHQFRPQKRRRMKKLTFKPRGRAAL